MQTHRLRILWICITFCLVRVFSATPELAPPVFSKVGSYCPEAFALELSVPDTGATIYYTTDGSVPTTRSASYSAPLYVQGTSVIRAVAVRDGAASQVITNSYLFISDIITQNRHPEGYPDRWGVLGGDVKYAGYAVGERAPAHYGMDADITSHSLYRNSLSDAFLSLPTLSLVTDASHFFSESTDPSAGGIYIHTGVKIGDGWERPLSVEYIDPLMKEHFQEDCGIRIHGAASRQPEKSGKHSFRLYFKSMYGAGKLKYRFFKDETAVSKFDHLVLRAGFGYSWMHWSLNDRRYSQYVVDAFAKRTQRAMGNLSAHNRFVHLFINGLYWGVYDVTERLSEKHMAAYMGGHELDYDVMNHNGLAAGNRTAFDRMVKLAESSDYERLIGEQLLDMENYIDYILVNFYMGNVDWGDNNWYAARNRELPDKGFRFFCWDTENCFYSGVNFNVMTGAGRFKGPLRRILFGADEKSFSGGLSQHPEFKKLFTQRAHLHLFNKGALTPEASSALYAAVSDEIDPAMILESARWGTYRRKTLPGDGQSPVYSRDEHFRPQKAHLLSNYFPLRTEALINQLLQAGLLTELPSAVPAAAAFDEAEVRFAKGRMHIELPQPSKITVSVYGVDSKLVMRQESEAVDTMHTLDFTGLKKTVYIYHLVYGSYRKAGKFIPE